MVISMPVYEYYCPVCANEIEVIQSFRDPPPKCEHTSLAFKSITQEETDFTKEKETDMKIKISKSSFALKGKGWFKTGY